MPYYSVFQERSRFPNRSSILSEVLFLTSAIPTATMTGFPWRLLVVFLALPCSLARAQQDRSSPPRLPAATDRRVDFLEDVKPILQAHCYECHAGEVEEGGLNLAIKAKAARGGEQGPVFLAGDSARSTLIHLVAGLDSDRTMPPEGNERLSVEQIAILRAWIDQGAQWPDNVDVLDPRLQRANEHWAFQRLRQDASPPNKQPDDDWSQTDIDRFIAEQLTAHRLSPSAAASGRTLVRRIYFHVIGLPPTPEQADQFIAAHRDNPTEAIRQLTEQLLGSRHFGERWGRHWLDLARYADSDGQESDRDRPHAFHYRDFVISALNDDMPYDQFVRWQIAGDEYERDNDAAVSATGFLTAGPSMKLKDSFLERERLFNRYNELDDMISTVGSGLLGLTVACARCHDHKYDAFSAREYYQLLHVFHSGDRTTAKLPSGAEGFFFQDFDSEVRTSWLFRRSDFYDREIEVELGFPQLLSDGKSAKAYWESAKAAVGDAKSTLQRRALAEWLTDVEAGGGALLARVIVNRIWQHYFGHGLVRTASDFGVRGDSPTHPELLEYLATDLVKHGWKLKRLHRKILTSAVWRQRSTRGESSAPGEARPSEVDPQNRLLWKMHPQRLEAEALRDAMLAVSGTLNLEAGGPGFKPYIPPEANLARNIQGGDYPKDAKDDETTRRRSVYMFHKRLVPYPLFQAFDRPDLMVSCARRQNTTVALQAIAILNDRFVRAVSRDFAKRLLETCDGDDTLLVIKSFEFAFSRHPNAEETAASLAFLQSQSKLRGDRNEDAPRERAVADYCHSLFGLNEFIYVD